MKHVNMVPKHGDTPVGHSVCSSDHTSKFMYRASHLVWPKLLYIEQGTVVEIISFFFPSCRYVVN